jgi:hypothetical protein
MPIRRERIFVSSLLCAALSAPFFQAADLSFTDEGRKEAMRFYRIHCLV